MIPDRSTLFRSAVAALVLVITSAALLKAASRHTAPAPQIIAATPASPALIVAARWWR
ncbi:hypothetical protein X566_15520 [Afipia sp. P52-10]|uniref:hypothetical protein n=1 Tax=Afipia sp. P52-10 TaxID=1429916 RepID=UPI0003DEF9F0|nr:hypothetical protein [Afipia sp. P52-10]ETR79173.1 hypothetical protein X566_15520 [Afipia sp. P52-10]